MNLIVTLIIQFTIGDITQVLNLLSSIETCYEDSIIAFNILSSMGATNISTFCFINEILEAVIDII